MSATATGPSSAEARELAGRVDADGIALAVASTILGTCYADRRDDAAFVDALERSVRDNIRAIVGLFAGRFDLATAPAPADALAFASLSATLGIPGSTLERAYLVGVADFWQRWFDLARAEDAELEDLIGEPTQLLFGYIDHVLVPVVGQYDQTLAEMVRTREHLRRTVLAQVLDGREEESDPAEIERALAYPVRAVHVAIGLAATDGPAAERRAAGLRAAADASCALVHQSGAGRWTVWLARHEEFGDFALSALQAALTEDDAVVSEPWRGLAGLRRTHEEVTLAAGVQRARRTKTVLLYREIRLDALLLSDPARARRFVEEELGALGRPDPRLGLIRETLLVWLSSGSHVSAAALLSVHENTVRNRVRQAEELLPGGVTLDRRTELQVALRLKRILG